MPEPGEPRRYNVSVVCRDEVSAFKPYLWHESAFDSGTRFRQWLLAKIINGERASYSAPKFARMQDRTRTQMLEDIVNNLANHLATGQIPKPYRRGSWRPIGHMRPSSPLLDSVRDLFEGYDQLSKDFATAFNFNAKMICDVSFNVARTDQPNGRKNHAITNSNGTMATGAESDSDHRHPSPSEYEFAANGSSGLGQTVQFADELFVSDRKMSLHKSNGCLRCHAPIGTVCVCTHIEAAPTSRRILGVRAILAIRSRVFLEMLYGFSTIGSSQNANLANQTAAAASAGGGGVGVQTVAALPAVGASGGTVVSSVPGADHLNVAAVNKTSDVSPEKKSKQQSVSAIGERTKRKKWK